MNIYVGNISWGLEDQDLEEVFAEHGTVTVSYTHLTLPTKEGV